MTRKQVGEWMAFFTVENEGEAVSEQSEEEAQIAALGLPEHAQAGLRKMIAKRKRK